MHNQALGFMTPKSNPTVEPTLDFDVKRMKEALASPRTTVPSELSEEEAIRWFRERAAIRSQSQKL